MSKNIHSDDELFDSPEYGWDQLQLMLDKKMPVNNGKNKRALFFRIAAAAVFISILLFSSLVIKNAGYLNFAEKNSAKNLVETTPTLNEQESAPNNEAPDNTATTQQPSNFKQQLFSNDITPAVKQMLKNTAAKNDALVLHKDDNNLPDEPSPVYQNENKETQPENSTTPDVNKVTVLNNDAPEKTITTVDTTNSVAGNKSKKNRKSSWGLSAGMAVNVMLGKKQNLRPYPVASLQYNVSDKFFLATGLGIASPVTAESRGISKTVYLNDTTNNVHYYNDIKNYYKLNYIDIPLMAGVNINKRFAVTGGVQASVLLNSKTKVSVESYDYQRNVANSLPANLSQGVVAASEEKYDAAARNIDYRIVAGLQYAFKKTTVRLNYQSAVKSVLTGNYVSKDKNQLLSLGLQFKIK